MKKLLTTTSIIAGLALASVAQAAPVLRKPTVEITVSFGSASDNVALIKNDKHKKGRKNYKKKRHYDNGRHEARGHDKDRYGYGDRRYNLGDTVVRYIIVDRPQRYRLNRYDRYVEDNGYVYAINPNTNSVLALIGLASRLLN